MRRASPIAAALLVVPTLMTAPLFAGGGTLSSPKWELNYHSVLPLGEDALLLGKRALFFLASAESIGFKGWRQVFVNDSKLTLASDGSRVERYPRFVDFRVTVSTRMKAVPGLQPLLVECESQCPTDLNDFLLNLRFRLKIFRGLDVTLLEPKLVKLVGMPVDVPYDERIYRLSFDLGDVPLGDRIVLEVLSPAGERLTKFHLDM